jgi:hypothetical protein
LFPLRTRIDAAGVLVVETAPSHYVKRGLVAALLVPPLVGFLAVLAAAADADAGALYALAAFAGVVMVAGLSLALLAPILSKRTRVRFDAGRGEIVRERDGFAVAMREAAGVVLRPTGNLGLARELVVVRADGSPIVVLHGAIASTHVAPAQAIANDIHAFFGVAPAAAPAPYRHPPPGAVHPPPAEAVQGALGMPPHIAAGLCYLPVQGIFLLASIVMLIGAKHPAVRFAAKQSLLQLALAFVTGIVVVGGTVGIAVTVNEHSPFHVPLVVLAIVVVFAFACWHLGAYIYACLAAFRGRVWVMPWLRAVIGKSAPPS